MGVCLHSLPMCHHQKKKNLVRNKVGLLVLLWWCGGLGWITKVNGLEILRKIFSFSFTTCTKESIVKELFKKFLFLSKFLIFTYLTHRKFTLNLMFALSFGYYIFVFIFSFSWKYKNDGEWWLCRIKQTSCMKLSNLVLKT